MRVILKIIAYYRVSSKKQGKSGLGLEAQRKAVTEFAAQHKAKIIFEYIEVETGTGKNPARPELAKATAHAQTAKATLVVAKLDRLARNVAFTSALMESGVDFLACDNPNANRLTIHILAAVAEDEAVATSRRTKDALAAAKARGKKLGSARPGHWKGREHLRGSAQATKASSVARTKRANAAYSFLIPKMQEMRASGMAFHEIATHLSEQGHVTTVGKPLTDVAVLRILRRAEEANAA